VPLTLIAGVGHWLLGSVDWVLLGSLVIGSLPGIFFGSHLSARVPDKVSRPVLATILVIVGCAHAASLSIAQLVLGAEKAFRDQAGRPRVGAFWKPGDPALISLPGPAWLGAR